MREEHSLSAKEVSPYVNIEALQQQLDAAYPSLNIAVTLFRKGDGKTQAMTVSADYSDDAEEASIQRDLVKQAIKNHSVTADETDLAEAQRRVEQGQVAIAEINAKVDALVSRVESVESKTRTIAGVSGDGR